MKKFSHSIAHAFLFAVFPILALLAFNISQLQIADGARAFIVLLLFAGAMVAILRALLGDWQRSALISSIFFLLLFSYGPMYDYLKQIELFSFVPGRHRLLLPIYGVLFLSSMIFVLRTSKQIRLTEFANTMAIVLVVLPVIRIANFELQAAQPQELTTSLVEQYDISLLSDGVGPDVYYIILDGYARDDVLLELGFDNTPFLEELETLGFFVAKCSRSNYVLTQLSLTSSMNMSYLDEMGIGLVPDALLDRATFDTTIRRDSQVIRIFEELAYTTVGFETGYRWSEFETADHYFAPGLSWIDRLRTGQGLTELESLLLFNSVGRVLFEENINLPEFSNTDLVVAGGQEHYDRINYVLDQLGNMPELENPKFVFAHLVIPHDPYVFGPDGSFAPTEEIERGYLNQVQFINREILSVLETLAAVPVPPIIILQSDHSGPYFDPPNRLYNLEAFYFPGEEDTDLYQKMTPVNIFRYIFSTYFDGNLPQIENRSFDSEPTFLFQLTEVPETRESCVP